MGSLCARCSLITGVCRSDLLQNIPLAVFLSRILPADRFKDILEAEFIWAIHLWDAANINPAAHFCMKAAQTGAPWTGSRSCGGRLFTSERVQAVQSETFSSSESVLVESSRFMLLTRPVSALLPRSDSALGLLWCHPAVRIQQPIHVSVLFKDVGFLFLKWTPQTCTITRLKMKRSPLNFPAALPILLPVGLLLTISIHVCFCRKRVPNQLLWMAANVPVDMVRMWSVVWRKRC